MSKVATYKQLLMVILIVLPFSISAQVLTLDSCLNMAKRNNVQLQKASIEVEKAKQVRNQAVTKYFPQITGTAMGYHSLYPLVDVGIDDVRNSAVRDLLNVLYGNYGAALGLSNTLSLFQYGYHAGVTAIQPIFVGGKIVEGNKLAKVGVEAAQLQYEIAARDVLEEVEEAYWLVVGLQEKRATIEAAQNLLDTLHRVVNAAVNAGLAIQSDLLQVELKQSEVHRTEIQLTNALHLATRALCLAVGIEDADSLPLAQMDTARFLLLPAEESINLQTPEAQLMDLHVRAAELQKKMVVADALPQIMVGANYGYGKISTNIFRDDLGSKVGNGALFVTMTIPLTQWWETGHKIKQYNLSLDEAKLDQQDVQRKLQLRNRQAYDQMCEASLLVSEYEKSLANAAENYRLINANYSAGLATITDLLTAQTTQLKAQNELTDARIQLLVTTRRYDDLINSK